jgi:hypothetical protein
VLFAQVCDAVQHAHQRGVVHRDLKPSNILVRPDGKPVVLDFGVARWLAGDERPTELLTRTGQLVGTPQYMSPEQVQAEPAGVGPESAVYPLGVILYELLSGRVPYEASSVSLHRAVVSILTKDPAPLREAAPEVSRSLERIVMMALEKEPRHRYANAGALADDLRRELGGRPVRARGPGLRRRIRRWSRRRQRLAAALVGLIALAALGIAWVLGSERPMPRERVLASYREAESLLIDAVPLLYQGERTPDRMRQAVAVLTRARQLIEDVPPLSHHDILARRLEKDLGTAQMLLAEMDWDLLAARQAVTSFERALATPFDTDPAHLRDRQLTDTGTGVPSDQEVRGLLAIAELTLHRLWGAPGRWRAAPARAPIAGGPPAHKRIGVHAVLGTRRSWTGRVLVQWTGRGGYRPGVVPRSAEAARQAAVWSDSAFAHRAAFDQDWPALGSSCSNAAAPTEHSACLELSAALDTAEAYLRWCATYRGPERPRVFAETRQEWARLALARARANPHSPANTEILLASVDGLDRARTSLAATGAIAPQLAAFRCQQAEVLAELALSTGSTAWLDSADVRLSQTATAFAPTSYPRMAGLRWIHSGIAEAARFELTGRPESREAARIAFDRARTIGRTQQDSLVLNTVERTLARLELSSPAARSLR